MRSWIAYKLVRWALWLDTNTTLSMALALSAESARLDLEARGLRVVRNGEGLPTLVPIDGQTNTDPTVH